MAICGFYLREFPSLVFLHGYSERSTLTEGERADGRRKEETEKNEGCVLIDEASFRLVTAFEEGPLVYALLTRWIFSSETAGRTPVSRCDPPDRDCILCRSMYNIKSEKERQKV